MYAFCTHGLVAMVKGSLGPVVLMSDHRNQISIISLSAPAPVSVCEFRNSSGTRVNASRCLERDGSAADGG